MALLPMYTHGRHSDKIPRLDVAVLLDDACATAAAERVLVASSPPGPTRSLSRDGSDDDEERRGGAHEDRRYTVTGAVYRKRSPAVLAKTL